MALLIHVARIDEIYTQKEKEIIKGIDCYSFGLLMPILFYNHNLIDYIEHSQIISDLQSASALLNGNAGIGYPKQYAANML